MQLYTVPITNEFIDRRMGLEILAYPQSTTRAESYSSGINPVLTDR